VHSAILSALAETSRISYIFSDTKIAAKSIVFGCNLCLQIVTLSAGRKVQLNSLVSVAYSTKLILQLNLFLSTRLKS
jgi:hypothetical protein